MGCDLCDGGCTGADLGPLLGVELRWLWEQVGAAGDRRGDAAMCEGVLTIRAPEGRPERTAVLGLLGERVLMPGAQRRVQLENLTTRLKVRGNSLTPGVVAAHALGRPLARRAREREERTAILARLQSLFVELMRHEAVQRTLGADATAVWFALRGTGAVARLAASPEPERLLRAVMGVVERLPSAGGRVDRRALATEITGNPHALDEGEVLPGFVLACLAAAGVIAPGTRTRDAWASVAVDCDDVTGGLIAVGIFPRGWTIPPGAAATLPPRTLLACEWQEPAVAGTWVFVTENPSIATLAADLGARGLPVRLLCTNGTPSAREIEAIRRLSETGWKIAVRADFDVAGLRHVAELLAGVPDATVWRMTAEDYENSRTRGDDAVRVQVEAVIDTPWDPLLAKQMRELRTAGFEERLVSDIAMDLVAGAPGVRR